MVKVNMDKFNEFTKELCDLVSKYGKSGIHEAYILGALTKVYGLILASSTIPDKNLNAYMDICLEEHDKMVRTIVGNRNLVHEKFNKNETNKQK